jgi:hypothetical protein
MLLHPYGIDTTLTNPPAGQVYRSYYFFGSVRVAMREFSGTTSVLTYLVTDHLGSTSLTLDASGVEVARMGYKPWGETRYASGSSSTDYKFTGQIRLDIGIYFYGARNYDGVMGVSSLKIAGRVIISDHYH